MCVLLPIIGSKFGKLIAEKELPSRTRANGRQRRYFQCRCACGGVKTSSMDNLKSGAITHCGCLSRRHNGTGTKLYGVWHRIIQCCTDKNYQAYPNYGGRGIKICRQWREFAKFREWAVSAGYRVGLTIDRINNNKGYSPANCRWVSPAEQNRNKRNNVWIKLGAERLIATDYAKQTNTPLSTVLYRHNKRKGQYAIQKSS